MLQQSLTCFYQVSPTWFCLLPLQEQLRKQYGAFQQWVEWVGPQAIEGLRNMEKHFTVNLHCLRDLRSIATPTAAKAILPTMLKDKVSRKDLDQAISRAVHDMLVDWSWSSDNDFIHPDRRMSFSMHWLCLAGGWPDMVTVFYARTRITLHSMVLLSFSFIYARPRIKFP